MTAYFYPAPTASPFDDISQYVALLLGAVDLELDRDDVWDPAEADDARGYMEDLKVYIQELPDMPALPIGSILPYAGSEPPSGFLWCNGTQYAKAAYPALAAVLNAAFSDSETLFHVPDLRSQFLRGWNGSTEEDNTGATGGEAEHTLSQAEMPAHNHVSDPHGHSSSPHVHTTNPHTHTQTAHGHSLTDPQHSHGMNHNHSIQGRSNSAAGANAEFMRSNSSGTDADSTTGLSSLNPTGVSATGITLADTAAVNQNATVTVNSATVSIGNGVALINPTGGDQPHNNLPPFMTIPYIIRAL